MIPTSDLIKDIYRTTWLDPDPPAVIARRDRNRARLTAVAALLRRVAHALMAQQTTASLPVPGALRGPSVRA
ncbi:MAG: hypothetical protein JWR51_3399 [Devosia sp.]|nr:hypothetical protein [Devosia sp.]